MGGSVQRLGDTSPSHSHLVKKELPLVGYRIGLQISRRKRTYDVTERLGAVSFPKAIPE